MEYNSVKPTNITENVLTALGRKMGSGRELTLSERLMAMTATAQSTGDRYGPGPGIWSCSRRICPKPSRACWPTTSAFRALV